MSTSARHNIDALAQRAEAAITVRDALYAEIDQAVSDAHNELESLRALADQAYEPTEPMDLVADGDTP